MTPLEMKYRFREEQAYRNARISTMVWVLGTVLAEAVGLTVWASFTPRMPGWALPAALVAEAVIAIVVIFVLHRFRSAAELEYLADLRTAERERNS